MQRLTETILLFASIYHYFGLPFLLQHGVVFSFSLLTGAVTEHASTFWLFGVVLILLYSIRRVDYLDTPLYPSAHFTTSLSFLVY